jgi:hypothetical protein
MPSSLSDHFDLSYVPIIAVVGSLHPSFHMIPFQSFANIPTNATIIAKYQTLQLSLVKVVMATSPLSYKCAVDFFVLLARQSSSPPPSKLPHQPSVQSANLI